MSAPNEFGATRCIEPAEIAAGSADLKGSA